MIHILFAITGLLTGVLINLMADQLPRRRAVFPPRCPHCGQRRSWRTLLAVARYFQGAEQVCGHPVRVREWLVEVATAVLFGALPLFITNPLVLVVNTFHIAVLILIIVIDLENRLILNVVVYPATAVALAASFFVPNEENTLRLALVGAIVGFLLFYLFYWIGQLLFGPGALGYGDVKLAMLMGAMLGFHRIIFALAIGILLGGIISALLLLSRRFDRHNYLPYGQYLALGGIIMLIWGVKIAAAYLN